MSTMAFELREAVERFIRTAPKEAGLARECDGYDIKVYNVAGDLSVTVRLTPESCEEL